MRDRDVRHQAEEEETDLMCRTPPCRTCPDPATVTRKKGQHDRGICSHCPLTDGKHPHRMRPSNASPSSIRLGRRPLTSLRAVQIRLVTPKFSKSARILPGTFFVASVLPQAPCSCLPSVLSAPLLQPFERRESSAFSGYEVPFRDLANEAIRDFSGVPAPAGRVGLSDGTP